MATEAEAKPPSTTRLALMLVVWIGVFLGAATAALRAFIRIRFNGRFQLDDFFVALALALLIASAVMYTVVLEPMFNLVEVSAGIKPPPMTEEEGAEFLSSASFFIRMEFAITLAFWTCLWSVKASFLTLFYHLSVGLKFDRMLWWIAVGITAAGYIFSVISYPVSCTSFEAGGCEHPNNIRLSLVSLKGSTVFDVLSDVAIILLPWKLLWVVKRSRAEKIAIGGIVGLGLLIITFAIIRVVVTNTTKTHPELVWLSLWSSIETTIAVVVISLTSLKVYIVKSARTGTGSNSGPTGGYTPRGPGFQNVSGASGGAIPLSDTASRNMRSHNGEVKQGSLSNDSDDFLVR